jgi:hypothetical protein
MEFLLEIVRAIASHLVYRVTSSERDSPDRVDQPHSDDLPVPVRRESNDQFDVGTLAFLYEDARRVIDHQIAYLSDVDDKAVWTVRINAVIIGAVLSVYQLSSQVSLTDPIPGVAPVAFLLSMAAGIVTYTTSDAQFGPGPRYIDTVLDVPAVESHWRRETLRSYADWIEDNEHVGRRNGTYLLVSQLLLLLGLATLTTGTAIELLAGFG